MKIKKISLISIHMIILAIICFGVQRLQGYSTIVSLLGNIVIFGIVIFIINQGNTPQDLDAPKEDSHGK